jgi:hypothetical protein
MKRLAFSLAVLCALLACGLPTPQPTVTPAPPTDTPTPVVVVVTATPTATPATLVDMDDLYLLPAIELLAIPLVEKYGADLRVAPWVGVPGGSRILLQYEQPKDSGQWYIAVVEPGGGLWPLLGVIRVAPTPTATATPTPWDGAGFSGGGAPCAAGRGRS